MFKELILAIIIGAILGLGITGGYMTMQHKSEPPKEKPIITEPTLIPTDTNSPKAQNTTPAPEAITISSPEPNALVTSEKLSIAGIAPKNSNIIIVTPSNSFMGKSDDQGKFQIAITLDSGLNMVKITAIDQENTQKDTSINVTYSTAKI